MNTEFSKSSIKDNVATSLILAAGLFAAATGAFAGKPVPATDVEVLDPIVVTAKHGADVKLDAIVVTASRKLSRG